MIGLLPSGWHARERGDDVEIYRLDGTGSVIVPNDRTSHLALQRDGIAGLLALVAGIGVESDNDGQRVLYLEHESTYCPVCDRL